MFDIQTILVPFDFSERCRAAARHAVALADRFQAKIVMIHVVPYSSFEYSAFEGGSYVGGVWPSEEEVAERLETEIARIEAPEEAKKTWERRILKGDPPKLIEEAAEEAVGPLIVMPTHGFGKFRRFILGSVTTKVLHDVNYPVLTGAHLADGHGFGNIPYRSVVCAVDLREHSETVLRWAAQFSRAWDAKLTLINAVNWLETGPADERYFTPELKSKLKEGALVEMARLAEKVGCEPEMVVEVESAAEFVPRAVEQASGDIVVAGRSLERGLLGILRTHANTLIRVSPCPVISV